MALEKTIKKKAVSDIDSINNIYTEGKSKKNKPTCSNLSNSMIGAKTSIYGSEKRFFWTMYILCLCCHRLAGFLLSAQDHNPFINFKFADMKHQLKPTWT